MSAVLIAIFLVVAIVAIVYYLAKKFMVLLVNAILGILFLFLFNFLHIMKWMEKPDLGYGLATVFISAIGGIPGVCILVLLDILGINL